MNATENPFISQVPAPEASPQPNTVPKRRKGLKIALALTGLIVAIGVGVFIGWWVFGKSQGSGADTATKQTTNQSQNQTSQTATTLTPEGVIGKIQDRFAAKYTLLSLDENNHPKSGQMSIRISAGPPAYKTEGYTYYTDYDGGSYIFMMPGPTNPSAPVPTAADTATRTEVANLYKELGLTKKDSLGDSSVSGDVTDVYIGQGLVCTVEAPQAGTSSNSAACGLVDAYKVMAEKVKPIADVLQNVGSSTYLAALKITNSPVNGYQRAQVNQGSVIGYGSIAFVYKKGSGPWVYFRNAQEQIACSDYNTTDLKNAFKGEPCYDTKLGATTYL